MRQSTRNLNSDFNAFDRKLNVIERWLHKQSDIGVCDPIVVNEEDATCIDSEIEKRNEDEKNQQLIQLVLGTDRRIGYYEYEETDNSYLNVTIRPSSYENQFSYQSYWSTDRSSFNSENDASLSHYSFSSGYSTN